jgi:hypothetical protein
MEQGACGLQLRNAQHIFQGGTERDDNFKQSMGFEPPVNVGEWMLVGIVLSILFIGALMSLFLHSVK